MMKNLKGVKGQAAIEYLMMYGWAIFIIVLVIGILVVITGMLNNSEYCVFTPYDFGCGDIKPLATTDANNYVELSIQMVNNKGVPILVKRVACIRGKAENAKSGWMDMRDYDNMPSGKRKNPNGELQINPGESFSFLRIPCYEMDGNRVIMSPGQTFTGTFLVEYNDYNDFETGVRSARASVATKVTQGN